MKKYVGIFVVAMAGAVAGAGIMRLTQPQPYYTVQNGPGAQFTDLRSSSGADVVENPDFIHTSAAVTPAVVHIKSYYKAQGNSSFDPWSGFFNGPGARAQQSAGSGVIVSEDGYIMTNNHVVKDAERVEVVLNDKRSYDATVIGTDPTTDLALIKIEAAALPVVPFGNSDQVQVGEWVLAVGNPFNLTSTVTAGIVSAKGRSLNLLDEEFAIESFIQTDAVVNPGNSGGALVNTRGELVGINTAIASQSGVFEGYSFAVPVNIVRKVMLDLREYGQVQRGIIGVQIRNIDANLAREEGLSTLDGAYVNGVLSGGAAEAAGLRSGDIITRINEVPVRSASELQEIIGTFRPGDEVRVQVQRGGEALNLPLVLRNREGGTDLRFREAEAAPQTEAPAIAEEDNEARPGPANMRLGAELAPITAAEKSRLRLSSGVKVRKLQQGLLADMGVEEGLVIIRINKTPVASAEDVNRVLAKSDGQIMLEGVGPDGSRRMYAYNY